MRKRTITTLLFHVTPGTIILVVVLVLSSFREDMFGYVLLTPKTENHLKEFRGEGKEVNKVDIEDSDHYRNEKIVKEEDNLTKFNKNFRQPKEVIKSETENALNETKSSPSIDSMPRYAKRNRTKHIAFLKVHKAGSTTIQNMLFRFGMKHGLNIILPKSNNQLKRKAQQMPIESDQHFDIFALHTIYNRKFFDSLLPADYVSVAIIRNPVARMISAAYYHRDVFHVKYLRMIPRGNFVHNLVNFPEKYDRAIFSQTRNTMARDFGFSKRIKETDKTKVQNYLNELNKKFKLVMVMEKIDESLILLRRLLNWSIADVIYLTTNNHKHHPVVLNQTEVAKFKETSSFDFDLYDYFSRIFNEKLKKVAKDFWEEVAYFKHLLRGVNEYCLNPEKTNGFVVMASKWDDTFNVSQSDCMWMNTKELSFISKLRERHYIRHNITKV